MSWIGRPVSLFTGLTHLMNSIGTLWVFAMMFMICADIFARNVFNHPLNGVPEIIGFSIVGTIYLQLANTLNAGRFTRAELLIEWLEIRRPFAGRVFNGIFNFIGVAVFVLLVDGFWSEFWRTWQSNEIAGVPGTITFIVWPFNLLLVVGATATGTEFLIRGVREFTGGIKAATARSEDGGKMAKGYGWLVALLAFVSVIYLLTGAELTNSQIGTLSILSMLVLIYAGMPIGIALILLGFCGIWMMKGNTIIAERMLAQAGAEYM
ncbi:MAG: TRAP transporter small permease subunit, partial [Alphaproteobacteria bacterium]